MDVMCLRAYLLFIWLLLLFILIIFGNFITLFDIVFDLVCFILFGDSLSLIVAFCMLPSSIDLVLLVLFGFLEFLGKLLVLLYADTYLLIEQSCNSSSLSLAASDTSLHFSCPNIFSSNFISGSLVSYCFSSWSSFTLCWTFTLSCERFVCLAMN